MKSPKPYGRKKGVIDSELPQPMHLKRLAFLTLCLLCGFGWLAYTLVQLQVVQHEKLTVAARNNTERVYVMESHRGEIRDCKGNVLATSKSVETICADPTVVSTNAYRIAKKIAPLLGADVEAVAERIRPRNYINKAGISKPVQYVTLKEKAEPEEWEAIRAAMDSLDFGINERALSQTRKAAYDRIRKNAIFATSTQVRYYPNKGLAAHVLGFVGQEEHDSAKGWVTETNGLAGVESSLNSILTGSQGWRQTETDSHKRELVPYRNNDLAARPGLNVVLTLDMGIQHIVETEIAEAFEKYQPTNISAIVVRPKTGEILAMATYPSFDPNKPGEASNDTMHNRTITDLAEPGSTFKVAVISGALNDGTVNLDSQVYCEKGQFRFGGKILHDHGHFEWLPVQSVIAKSSNIGAAKVAIQMGAPRLYQYIRAFGFGEPTGIPLPGERIGTVHPLKQWQPLSITRIPMGHEVAVTPLQMIMAISTIANKGLLMKPMLINRYVDENNQTVVQFQPQPSRQVVSPSTAARMTAALKLVVSTNGTGLRAKLKYYVAAGKTGTAQKIEQGTYVHDEHYVSFIGFFPADNPELCISVVLDDPHNGGFGGDTAAPVFAKIADRSANYLALAPEIIPPGEGPRQPVAVAGLKIHD